MTMPRPRVFLLSPANCGGMRARMIVSPNARFPLALQMREESGAPIGDIFSFVSGLYFRGKLAYARRFAAPPDPDDPLSGGGIFIITPNAGLRTPDTPLTLTSFRAFSKASIDLTNTSYRRSIERAAAALRETIGEECEVVLLGSIASGKYVEVLQPIFGDNLLFPPAFVGRGDMSRGGLMLRCVADGTELDYAPIAGAIRHGKRPPKLVPLENRDSGLRAPTSALPVTTDTPRAGGQTQAGTRMRVHHSWDAGAPHELRVSERRDEFGASAAVPADDSEPTARTPDASEPGGARPRRRPRRARDRH
jgi:hypothetical protein